MIRPCHCIVIRHHTLQILQIHHYLLYMFFFVMLIKCSFSVSPIIIYGSIWFDDLKILNGNIFTWTARQQKNIFSKNKRKKLNSYKGNSLNILMHFVCCYMFFFWSFPVSYSLFVFRSNWYERGSRFLHVIDSISVWFSRLADYWWIGATLILYFLVIQ